MRRNLRLSSLSEESCIKSKPFAFEITNSGDQHLPTYKVTLIYSSIVS